MNVSHHQAVRISRRGISRRSFLHTVSAASLAAGTLTFRDVVSVKADELKKQGRSMILLWMQGGPSQFETFDPKPGEENGGTTEAIETSVPGIRIAEGWDQTAKVMQEIALIRSMTNKEGNHQRATYQLHTGYIPSGSVKHPMLGSWLATQLADAAHDLPSVVSVGATQGAGFLGVDYEPFVVARPGELPQNVPLPVGKNRYTRRLGLLERLESDFASSGGKKVVDDHQRLYQKASKLVMSPNINAFDISNEPQELRDRYGDTDFGKGCLLARRLVETGVTFVEVRHSNWDTHQDNFERTATLSGEVDPAFSTLISDLKERGQLDKTLIVWMGEFGRTPKINPRGGRDHYPRVFNVALAGGGVKGGQVIGSSSSDGSSVENDPVSVGDLFASVCHSLQVDPHTQRISPLGRPLKIVEEGKVVEKLFS